MKSKSIGLNAALNVIKYSLAVIFPIITYPYAIRTLGADGIGKVSFSNSVLTYFSLLAMLGVSTYGIREGSKIRNDKQSFNAFASELFTINVLSTVISYVLLIISVLVIHKFHQYVGLIAVQSISILLTTLGVDWINTVYEDFIFITIRSIIAHCITLVLLFALVHTPEDYYYYALLTIATNGITCVTNWIYCRKYARIRLTKNIDFKKHIKPLMYLFVNALTISIYVNIDTTMLGWMKGDFSVGVYTVSVKIYTIMKNIMIAVYSVTLPRLATYIGENKINDYKSLLTKIWSCVAIILLPVAVGLICFADDAMYFMGGKTFISYQLSLQILAGSLIFAIFGGLTTAVMNITLNREKDNMVASFLGAFLNFALNLFFIPKFGIYGAAFTTLLSELLVFVFCFIRIPHKEKYLDYRKVCISIIHAIVGSTAIALSTFAIKSHLSVGLMRLVIIIPICIAIYIAIMAAFKDSFFLYAVKKIICRKYKRKD